MRIWFHGTDKVAAEKIAAQGFMPNSWFAGHLEDAIEFGGSFVFMVLLDYEPRIDGGWQMCVGPAVPVQAIRRLTEYVPRVVADFPERGAVAFASAS
jgi:hypothetical protein